MELDAQTQARRLDHGALWLMSDILFCKKAKILWHPPNWQNTSKKKRIQSEHNGPESWPEWQSTSLSLKIWNWTEILQHKLYMRLFTSAPEIPAPDPTTGQPQSDAPGDPAQDHGLNITLDPEKGLFHCQYSQVRFLPSTQTVLSELCI